MNYVFASLIFLFSRIKICICAYVVNCKFIFNNVSCVFLRSNFSNCIIYHHYKCLLIYCAGYIFYNIIFIFMLTS